MMKLFPILKPLTIALMLTTTIAHAEHEFQPVDCPKIQGYDIHSSCDKNTPIFPIIDQTTGLHGYANLQGEILVQPQFEDTNSFEKYGIVMKNGKWGAIDLQANTIIPFEYDRLSYTSAHDKGYFSALKQGKIGLLDTNGKVVLDFIYDTTDEEYGYLLHFNSGLAYAEQKGKIGYIDITGKAVVPFIYEAVNSVPFTNNIIGIKKNGKWGVIDKQNNVIIPFIYKKEVHVFEDDLILIEKNNKVGIINQKQNVILPAIYDYILPLYHHKKFVSFIVEKDNKYGLLDGQGQALTSLDHDSLEGTSRENTVIVVKNNLKGAMDFKGNILIPVQYKEISISNDDVFQVKDKNNQVSYINIQNK